MGYLRPMVLIQALVEIGTSYSNKSVKCLLFEITIKILMGTQCQQRQSDDIFINPIG